MAQFTGTLMIIGNTSFLDNVLLVRKSDPATTTSFLQNRGLGAGDYVVITGASVMINTTPAIEVQNAARAAVEAVALAAATAVPTPSRAKKKTATKKARGKATKRSRQ